MVFSSFGFLFGFLPLMLLCFYLLRYFKQDLFAKISLIIGSFVFYGFWNPLYLPLLLGSIVVNFLIGNAILKSNPARIPLIVRGGGQKYSLKANQTDSNPVAPYLASLLSPKFYVILGIVFNLALLGFFKYTDFFLENLNTLSKLLALDLNIPLPHILLPLAISFFTFQQIAFLVDCYKRIDVQDLEEEEAIESVNVSGNDKNNNAESNKISQINFLDYCLFVSFFPQLIAGPIVHHKEMMPQFKMLFAKSLDSKVWGHCAKGLFIFSIGLFKKVFIADSFAKWANAGFKVVEEGGILNIAESWATSISYTFQIYFDFSGYCDMAIGLGLFFGIVLPINFNSPYKSLNITEFWRKWHITLGRFLKDYLYIPLGGNRLGKILTLRNLFIVAFLSGIWHGAGFGFIIWGALHGVAMCVHRIYTWVCKEWVESLKGLPKKIYSLCCWILTFNFINITWIFFRAENLQGALNLLKGMFGIVWVEMP
ncbi:MBOAT family O-acyltransferase, partial [Helicobacter sp. MIT 05-5294]|uniref:MBOAT family O-acyltransferase n=1 Tax=Helicobacter sp. MIT 05-5294 TaxID=1548150 RepID=UPI0010FDC209